MVTFRSRGSDMSAVARLCGSRRTSIIVSERPPVPLIRASRELLARWSEPMSRIVWGLPESACASTLSRPLIFWLWRNAVTTRFTSLKDATATAVAEAAAISSVPISSFFQMPCFCSSNAEVPRPEALRDHDGEVDERTAVALERRDRDPLLGPVVATADRAELDRRHPGFDEADRVGGSVAADRDAVRRSALVHRLGEREHEGVVARHVRRLAVEDDLHRRVRDRLDLREDRAHVLARQVADVDVDHAEVRDLVERVAAQDAPEADRGPVEELRRVAGERHRLDTAEDVDGLEHRVVALPRRRPVRGGARHLDAHRQHALRLDADVKVGGLPCDREVPGVALGDEVVRAAVVRLVGFLVRDAEEVNADGALRRDV